MIMMKRSILVLFVLTILVFLWMGQEQRRYTEGQGERPGLPHVGHVAPDFTLKHLFTEEEIHLSSLYGQGDGVVLYFWTSWCPFCASSMESLQRAYGEYGEEIVFLGVNVTNQDTIGAAQQFINDHQIDFSNVKDVTGEVSASYFVPPVPTTLFLAGDGSIVHRKVGGLTYQEIEQGVRLVEREK
ncbi:MAG: TlpA family protein disulfide reductase [Bacillus sp. (in: Bacteria)]|nr:TlpA family protein disulfide reductase [Bacillus sp. (in: firmicutes)]